MEGGLTWSEVTVPSGMVKDGTTLASGITDQVYVSWNIDWIDCKWQCFRSLDTVDEGIRQIADSGISN